MNQTDTRSRQTHVVLLGHSLWWSKQVNVLYILFKTFMQVKIRQILPILVKKCRKLFRHDSVPGNILTTKCSLLNSLTAKKVVTALLKWRWSQRVVPGNDVLWDAAESDVRRSGSGSRFLVGTVAGWLSWTVSTSSSAHCWSSPMTPPTNHNHNHNCSTDVVTSSRWSAGFYMRTAKQLTWWR